MMKKKRTLKGMTLIEIIIAMFVLTAMAAVLLGIGLNVDQTTKDTNGMKDKLTVETPYAANNVVQFRDNAGDLVDITPVDTVVHIEYDDGASTFTQDVDAHIYETDGVYDDSLIQRGQSSDADKQDDVDLRFITVDPVT